MLTLAICTFNRSRSLAKTLEALVGQTDVNWSNIEIIVIDNNSTDDTPDILQAFVSQLPMRWLVERAQGLSHARNRAIEEARGDWIIFTDDDVILESSWLSAYQHGLSDFGDAGFAGGRVTPDWCGRRPRWFRDAQLAFFDGLLVWCEKGARNRYLEVNETGLVGASFAINLKLVGRSMRFRSDLGHKGSTPGLGEETELIQRMQRSGIRGVYVGSASCGHPVDFNRLTLKGLYLHGIRSGQTHRKMHDVVASGSVCRAGGFLVRGLGQLMRGRGDRFRQCIINAGFEIGLRDRVGSEW